MTGREIVNRARSLSHMVYWYGGKRQKCTTQLALQLMKQNPNVWTDSYFKKAVRDIHEQKMCCDCSGLVCHAYLIHSIGSYQIRQKYRIWTGAPLAGMIGWKSGHVGIFSRDGWDAPIIEMRGIDYDYQEKRTFRECGFTHVLYDPDVSYTTQVDDGRAVGWHSDKSGWWYRHTYGTGPDTYYHDTAKIINGHCYLFDSDGYICEVGSYLGKRIPATSDRGWIDG